MHPRNLSNAAYLGFSVFLVGSLTRCADPPCPSGTMLVSGRCIEKAESGIETSGTDGNAGVAAASGQNSAGTSASPAAGTMSSAPEGGAAAAGPQTVGSSAAGVSGGQTNTAGTAAAPAPDGGASMTAEKCATDGTIRCGVSDPGLRERCSGGQWAPISACASGETCTGDGSCQPVSALCRGSAGEAVCDAQGAMLLCNADGTAMPLQTCMTAALCKAGLPNRACASCMPGQHKCSGVMLQVCSPDGMGFTRVEDCDTAGLCNEMLGRCTTAVCDANKKSCMGNTLVTCNADGTAFTNEKMQCASGMCDPAGGDCNMCEPGSKSCGGDSIRTCNPAGQGYDTSPCSGGHCIEPGKCVACSQDSHCSSSDACKAAYCTTANGCSTRNADDGTRCASGVCQTGRCVECISSVDCRNGARPACDTLSQRCVQCTEDNHCTPEICDATSHSCRSQAAQERLATGTSCRGGYKVGGTVNGTTFCVAGCVTKADCPSGSLAGVACQNGSCAYFCDGTSTNPCPPGSTCPNKFTCIPE